MKPSNLFDLSEIPARLLQLLEVEHVWEVLSRLDEFGTEIEGGLEGDVHPTAVLEGEVYVAPGASVGPHAYIQGPAWLEPGAHVGHGAFIRGPVVLLAGAKVGHASEVKRSLFLPEARAPHFNYVGDSIIGRDANLGAGVKVANFKAFGSTISMNGQSTGLRKLGAAVGDHVSIGCNAVLSPGTTIGPRTVVYNGALVRGDVPASSVVKARLPQEVAELR